MGGGGSTITLGKLGLNSITTGGSDDDGAGGSGSDDGTGCDDWGSALSSTGSDGVGRAAGTGGRSDEQLSRPVVEQSRARAH